MVKKYWQRLYQVYPEYQLLFRINSEYIGVANSAPIYWNGNIDNLPAGFDEAIEIIIEENKKPNTLCGMAVVISKEHLVILILFFLNVTGDGSLSHSDFWR